MSTNPSERRGWSVDADHTLTLWGETFYSWFWLITRLPVTLVIGILLIAVEGDQATGWLIAGALNMYILGWFAYLRARPARVRYEFTSTTITACRGPYRLKSVKVAEIVEIHDEWWAHGYNWWLPGFWPLIPRFGATDQHGRTFQLPPILLTQWEGVEYGVLVEDYLIGRRD